VPVCAISSAHAGSAALFSREMLIKSKFIIPANAGIRPKEVQSQEHQRTGHRLPPV
jgi:hypothetical protein